MVKPRAPLGAYMRVSRVAAREELRSPDWQREAIERFAKAERLEVEWFEPELDVSGAKAKRPILDAIIERVKSGALGGLVVAKLDRLSRMRPKDRVLLFEEIEDAGGVVLSASEQLDPSTPEGRFSRDVFLGVARMQWENYAEGFEKAKRGAVAAGIPVQTRPAVGYLRGEGRRLQVDASVAPVIRLVFERRARGAGPSELAGLLKSRGVKTSQGSRTWSKQAVYGLLRNRIYLGELQYGGRYVNTDSHDAIVDLALWTAAQHPNGRQLAPAKSKQSTWLLTGILRCRACRYCLQGTTTSRGKRIYRCNRSHAGGVCPEPARIDADLVEHAAVEAFWALTADLEAQQVAQAGPDLSGLERVLETADSRLTQWMAPEVQDAVGDLGEYTAGLRDRRSERDRAAAVLGEARAVAPETRLDVSAETLRGAWGRMSVQDRRELLGLRFHCLALGRDRSLVVYPAGADVDFPRRGFKHAPVLEAFPAPPDGARLLSLAEAG